MIEEESNTSFMVIIPNYIDAEIDKKLDEALADAPDAVKDRLILREQLVSAFCQYGVIPDFCIAKTHMQ